MAAIKAAERIVLITHCNPDGDGIGAQQALYEALVDLGKQVSMHNRDGVPRIYTFLEHAQKVGRGSWPEAREQSADLIIALDCGAFGRLGMAPTFFAGATLLNIDHHASNKLFGDINIVDARYCATGAMIYDLMLALETPLSPAAASAIYTAIMTDTASFRLASATPDVYRLAATLIEAGGGPRAVYGHSSHTTAPRVWTKYSMPTPSPVRSISTSGTVSTGRGAPMHMVGTMSNTAAARNRTTVRVHRPASTPTSPNTKSMWYSSGVMPRAYRAMMSSSEPYTRIGFLNRSA